MTDWQAALQRARIAALGGRGSSGSTGSVSSDRRQIAASAVETAGTTDSHLVVPRLSDETVPDSARRRELTGTTSVHAIASASGSGEVGGNRPVGDNGTSGTTGTTDFEGELPGDACADAFEERAALIESGAGVPRDWAEAFAGLCVMAPPVSVAPARWAQLLDDAGRFLDCWAREAVALGWTAADVFGDGSNPLGTGQDRTPLIVRLADAEVEAIDRDGCTVRTDRGDRRVIRRDGAPVAELMRVGRGGVSR